MFPNFIFSYWHSDIIQALRRLLLALVGMYFHKNIIWNKFWGLEWVEEIEKELRK